MRHDPTQPVAISVVSANPEWFIRLTELVRSHDPRAFRSLSSAIAESQDASGVVLVVGPTETEQLLANPIPELTDPQVQVVAVVDELDMELLRRAMAIGLADVVGPADVDALASTVGALAQRLSRPAPEVSAVEAVAKPGRVVIVTSCRSGQGSTTVATNLAAVLARSGPAVLAEGDPRFGDLLDAFGYRTGDDLLVRSGLLTDHWVGEFLYRDRSGLLLMVPPQDSGQVLAPEHLVDAVAVLQSISANVVIDMPLWVLERFHLHRVADVVLLVTTDSIRDLRRVGAGVASLGLGPAHGGLVVRHQQGPKGDVHRTARDAGVPVLGELPVDAQAGTSLDDGRPLVESSPASPVAKAIEALAARLAADWPN